MDTSFLPCIRMSKTYLHLRIFSRIRAHNAIAIFITFSQQSRACSMLVLGPGPGDPAAVPKVDHMPIASLYGKHPLV